MKRGDRRSYRSITGDMIHLQYDCEDYMGAVNIRLLHEEDETAHEPFEYDRRCSLCWLGYPHSRAYHKDAIRRAEEDA